MAAVGSGLTAISDSGLGLQNIPSKSYRPEGLVACGPRDCPRPPPSQVRSQSCHTTPSCVSRAHKRVQLRLQHGRSGRWRRRRGLRG